jgi:hypothetical protein
MKIKQGTLLVAAALAFPALHSSTTAAPTKTPAKKTAAKKMAPKKMAAKPGAKKMAAKPGAAKPAGNVTAITFVTPPATYTGTPRQIRDTTARPWKARPKIYLPKGAQVVSKGKTVTSSDDFPIIGTLSMITDGVKEGTEGSWVELGPGPQWIQIDMGKPTTLYGVLLWHYFGESRVYRDVVVQASNDADFVTGVTTLYNNDGDNSSGMGIGKDIEYYEHNTGQWIQFAKPQKARYLRLYSRGNTSDPQNQYIEAEVWGDPNK